MEISRIPALTLQPIVENAVKHGSGTEKFRLEISIRTEKTADGAEITVEDNGPGFVDQARVQNVTDQTAELSPEKKNTHIGLANVRERLELMCGGTLSVNTRPEGGTSVTIHIPDSN